MKKILFIVFAVLSTLYGTQIQAQTPVTPNWAWATNIDGAGSVATDDDGSIFTDTAGNSYIVNQISSHVNIKKYDATGTLVWNRIGSSGAGVEIPKDITVDATGNYYITGSYTGSATFGAVTLANTGESDIFIVKYDSNGNVLWAQKYGDTKNDQGNSIAVDSNGNCYIGGYTQYTLNYRQIFYAKYNSLGVVQWTKADGGYYNNISSVENGVNAISFDSFGNTYLTGYYRNSSTSGVAFVRKCDPSGNTVWSKYRTEYSIGNDIVADNVGNSYVTGFSSSNGYDIFVTKYDAAGQIIWTQTAGGIDKDYGDGIAIDADGNCYVSGRFQQDVTFGPIAISNLNSGVSDAFVAKYDNLGDIVWVQQTGESGEDAASKIGIDAAGNCYINGYYTTNSTFGSTILSGMTRQPFMAKIGNYVEGSETITTLPLASHNYNAGGAISVPFSTKGNFPVGTKYTVELSDPSGSFFYPKYIGVGTTSPISCVIPSLTIPASEYRIRVTSTTPEVLGTDNGSAITVNGNSQLTTPDWSWATNIDGSTSVATTDDGSIFTDTAGNSYIVNQISSHVNIKKYDAAGTLVWDHIGSSGSGVEIPTDITVDSNGNYYITGSYTGSATFGTTTLANTGESDIFIVKYDSNGNVLWAQKYGDTKNDQGNSIAVDSNGNCYIGGYTQYTLNYRQIFYAKYDSLGVVQWTKADGGYYNNILSVENGVNAISVDSFGNTYFTGFYRNSSTTGVVFVRKCDPSGNTVWSKYRTEYSIGNDIVTDNAGNSYVTGTYSSSVGGYNIFTTKYNAAGVVIWEQDGIGLDADYGTGVALDANGNCFVTGRFQHNTDFSTLNISNTSSGISDVFVAKYDNTGNIAWLQQAGESGEDAGSKIGVDADGNCYINGYYTTSTNCGTTTLNGVTRNPFLAKIGITAETTLGTAVVKGENFCGGAVVTVDFAITGKYEDDNVFTAQLSDASGSFASPVNIGTLESAINTSIYAIIPLATPAGTAYRIRVISSNPLLVGNDNGIDVAINQTDCKSNIVTLSVNPIAAIEYFIDTDPGVGMGTALTTTGGLTVSESFQIALPTLTEGFHSIFIRTQDTEGVWSMYEGRVFYIQPTVTVLETSPVVAGEYFIDTEPGVGNGTAIASMPTGDPISLTTQVPTTGLAEGFHNLFFRAKDDNGKWGMYEGRVFYIQPTAVSTAIEPIVAAEYYFDTDPGLGMATTIDTGTPAELITVAMSDVATSALSSGDHVVFIRVKDNANVWSLTEKRTFTICSVLLTAPIVTGNAVVCWGQGLTLTAANVTGATSYLWSGPNGFTATTQSITIDNLQVYQTGEYTVIAVNGTGPCGTGPATKITVSINTVDQPTGTQTQIFCNVAKISELQAMGSAIKWYTDPSNGTLLDGTIALTNNTWYYASQSLNSCESVTRLPVFVTINATPAPNGDTNQTLDENQTIASIIVTGTDIKWYNSEEDATSSTNPLDASLILEKGKTYYATQTIDGCTSATSLAVTISITLGNDSFDSKSFSYYPNPIKDVLNFSYSTDLKSVKVFNLLGQVLLSKNINAKSGQIDMRSLSDGYYLIEVKTEDASKIFKVIKSNN
jgi:hypothetical protein